MLSDVEYLDFVLRVVSTQSIAGDRIGTEMWNTEGIDLNG
jgi:hypothetical protein